MTELQKPKLLIVEDDLELRGYLCSRLRDKYEISEVSTGEQAIEAALEEVFPAVVLDLRLGEGMSGIETLRRLKAIEEHQQVIVFTGHSDEESARAAANMWVFQYLLKPEGILSLEGILPEAIKLYREKKASAARSGDPEERMSRLGLSRREMDVTSQVIDGRANEDIASRLGISRRTVERHMSNIFEKLGIASRGQLTAKLLGAGKAASAGESKASGNGKK